MHVVLFAAQSVDGWITRGAEPGDAFASEADKIHFRAALRACDACVLGAATYAISRDRMNPRTLPGLRRVVWTRSPTTAERLAETIPGVLEFTDEAPAETAVRLQADGRRRCALLGGGQVNSAWLAARLVDELCLTVESRLFGAGTPLARPRPGDEALDLSLDLLEARTLAAGGPLLLRYAIKR